MSVLFRHIQLVNEGAIRAADVLIEGGMIADIGPPGSLIPPSHTEVFDGKGLHLFPGVIDDQVHFREPGLTHKGTIYSESRAAVAGGITSFMEMPNTIPPAVDLNTLEEKFDRAGETSLANYSFYLGVSSDNLSELNRMDLSRVCGAKIFLGSSTGNLKVEQPEILDAVFREVPGLLAAHCEYDPLIAQNLTAYHQQYGENIPMRFHPLIRSEEACYRSTSEAIERAVKFGTRLHVLHLSTARELSLFSADLPLADKRITAEACIHHLWFSDDDYERLGARIKWNPAIKSNEDRAGLRDAVRSGLIDVVATDHAPHTLDEKSRPYSQCPSGGPLVQHALVAMLELARRGVFSIEDIPRAMAHQVADLFRIDRRGYIRKGYYADLVVVDLNDPWMVAKDNLLYHCGWSPFEGETFHAKVKATMVNGHIVWHNGTFVSEKPGMRLQFNS